MRIFNRGNVIHSVALFLVLTATLVYTNQAYSVVVDFESLSGTNQAVLAGPSASATLTIEGITVTAIGDATTVLVYGETWGEGGSKSLGICDTACAVNATKEVHITKADASAFSLTSLWINDAGGSTTGTIEGWRSGSRVYGPTAISLNGTISVSNWDNLDEVRIIVTGDIWGDLDNFTYDAAITNTSPAISIDNSSLNYSENASATQIDTAGTLNDPDGDADWDGGTLEVEITVNAEAADEISIPDNLVGTINTNGTSLFDGATAIGTLDASEGIVTGGTRLTITFNANATNSLVQQVLRAIHYRNTSDDPGTSSRTVTFTATDSNSASVSDTRTVAVSASNDNPQITSNSGGATATINLTENTTVVTTVTETDPDAGDTHTYSISGGADSALFNINSGNGLLTFLAAPNFEAPADAGANNVYNVQVTVTDNGADNLTDVQDIAVTVTDANDSPVINSNGGGATASINIGENTTAVTTVTETDPDAGDTHTFSISDGADSALFTINSSSGALAFASAPDFETPTDAGGNNVYDVQVTVTDSGASNLTDAQDIAVTISNINESPVINSNGGGATASINIGENTTAVTTVTETDPDAGDTHTYSISGGADSALFSINSSSGALTFASAPDFETPTDAGGNNVYDVQVTVTDSGAANLTDTQAIAVTVTDANDAPVISGTPATTTPSVGVAFSFTPTASDPDSGSTLTFSINTTPAWAAFNTTTGELSGTPSAGDTGNVTNNITISVSDGSLSDSLAPFTLTVMAGNRAPTIGGTPEALIGEGAAYSFIPTASDADTGVTLTFAITNKPAWAAFNSTNGALTGVPGSADIGEYGNIRITVSDGALSASLPAFSITVYGDLDGDGISDATDSDIDGDGMSNEFEEAHGLDPRDPSDADSDLDGDGLTNLEEYNLDHDPTSDDYPPVLTVPADVTVNAEGLFTAVDIGTATAVDALDGEITPSSDAASHFKPGVHTVNWSAQDAAGNTTTQTQLVNVVPLVEFSKSQVSTEGSIAHFNVILNGPPVSYPVTVPYTVGGSAATDGSDHDLVDGSATIDSPDMETSVTVNLVNDGAGEGSETLIVIMGAPTNANAGPINTHVIEILEGNVPPTVSLNADQGSGITRIVGQADGNITVTADITDPNAGDSHSYDWSRTDNALVDSDSADSTFTIDPTLLTPGTYTVNVVVSDGIETAAAELMLNLIAAPPVLDLNDSDGDGESDEAEGHGDSDADGVPNYLDHNDIARNVVQELTTNSSEFLMETEPGLVLNLGSIAFRAASGSTAIDESEIETHGNDGAGALGDEGYAYNGGLFDFTIDELPVAGQSVHIVIAQFAAIPADAVYRKLLPDGWQDFVVDDNNLIASAPGAEGFCPPPNDAEYVTGLVNGYWCVQLTIEDGGPNDADREVNQAVDDPGGVAVLTDAPSPVTGSNGGGGGGGAMSLWLLLLIGVVTQFLLRLRQGEL